MSANAPSGDAVVGEQVRHGVGHISAVFGLPYCVNRAEAVAADVSAESEEQVVERSAVVGEELP